DKRARPNSREVPWLQTNLPRRGDTVACGIFVDLSTPTAVPVQKFAFLKEYLANVCGSITRTRTTTRRIEKWLARLVLLQGVSEPVPVLRSWLPKPSSRSRGSGEGERMGSPALALVRHRGS